MQLNVTGVNLSVTDAMKEYVETKFQRLERHFSRITKAHVMLSVEKINHRSEAVVHVAQKELVADSNHGDMYAAIDAMISKLDRQLRRYKEKQTDHHRATGGLHPHRFDSPDQSAQQ